MTALRSRLRSRRRLARLSFLSGLATVLEQAADDSETLCDCADGHRCIA